MDYRKLSDEALVSYVQNNEGQGYEEIINRYQSPLLRYAIRLLGDQEAAEDVVQDTFISTYENINSFDVNRKFSSWIYRIGHNKSINEIRKNKKNIALEEAPEITSEDNKEKIEGKISKEEAQKILGENIGNLTLKYKEVIILRYIEDKSYEEISDILKIPTSTVGVRIKRGLDKLKTRININIKDYL